MCNLYRIKLTREALDYLIKYGNTCKTVSDISKNGGNDWEDISEDPEVPLVIITLEEG